MMRRMSAKIDRMTPITITPITRGSSASCCWPFRTSSITRLVMYGNVIVQPINASAAMAVTATDHLYGRRNVSSLRSVRRNDPDGW